MWPWDKKENKEEIKDPFLTKPTTIEEIEVPIKTKEKVIKYQPLCWCRSYENGTFIVNGKGETKYEGWLYHTLLKSKNSTVVITVDESSREVLLFGLHALHLMRENLPEDKKHLVKFMDSDNIHTSWLIPGMKSTIWRELEIATRMKKTKQIKIKNKLTRDSSGRFTKKEK